MANALVLKTSAWKFNFPPPHMPLAKTSHMSMLNFIKGQEEQSQVFLKAGTQKYLIK